MTIKSKIYLLSGLASLVGITSMAALVQRSVSANDRHTQIAVIQINKVDLARSMQVALKQEIQEWNALLLNRNDPQAFFDREQEVKKLATEMDKLLVTPRSRAALAAFNQSHEELGQQYRRVLGHMGASANRETKGKDAVPTAQVDAIVASIKKNSLTFLDSENEAGKQEARTVLVTGGLAWCLFFVVSFFLIRSIIAPLDAATKSLVIISTGDLTSRVNEEGRDEIGSMGRALNRTMDKVSQTMGSITEDSALLAASSERLSAVSRQLKESAGDTHGQIATVSAAAGEVSKNLQAVAAAAEEMSASIREIARHSTEAASATGSAKQAAEVADATVLKLNRSTTEIGQVLKVIGEIAAQTQLLALNAAIEAARAGEAGKGFAVVAQEVKELAKKTTEATADVGRRIGAIQSDSKAAAAAFRQIDEVMGRVNDIANSIASAVEEQSVTTREIVSNVHQAATGSSTVAASIVSMSQAASGTSRSAENTDTAAGELTQMAAHLQSLVSGFKCQSNNVVEMPSRSSSLAA